MNIMQYLQGHLKAVGPSTWPDIELATGVKEPLIRKIAYGNRTNPGVQKVQPLIDYFSARDARRSRKGGA